MIQYLKYNSNMDSSREYTFISGKRAALFFSKEALILLLLFYSTLFLAAAIPFMEPHSPVIYAVGILITAFFSARYVNNVILFSKFNGGKICFNVGSIDLEKKEEKQSLKADEILFSEYTVLGNISIKTEAKSVLFPLYLLSETDRQSLLDHFQDMVPSRTRIIRKTWEFVDAVLMALVLAVHIIQYVIQNYYIPTESMKDTLLPDDHLFAEKLTYGPRIPKMLGMDSEIHLKFLSFRDVQRGDIIIFKPPAPGDETKDYIKRVVAVEGDEFHIDEDTIFVNGVKQVEPYVRGVTNYNGFHEILLEGKVPKGMVIAMGDNRENSQDSRYFGYLPKERIKAKAFIMYFNWNDIVNFNFKRIGLIR